MDVLLREIVGLIEGVDVMFIELVGEKDGVIVLL